MRKLRSALGRSTETGTNFSDGSISTYNQSLKLSESRAVRYSIAIQSALPELKYVTTVIASMRFEMLQRALCIDEALSTHYFGLPVKIIKETDGGGRMVVYQAWPGCRDIQ